MPVPDPERDDAHGAPRGTASPSAGETLPQDFVCLRDKTDDGTIRFTVSGELDIATAPELGRALQATQQRAQHVTVDLRRLSFMDARGLAVIVAAAQRAAAGGSSFRVVRGPPHVHRLFALTETDQTVAITQTG